MRFFLPLLLCLLLVVHCSQESEPERAKLQAPDTEPRYSLQFNRDYSVESLDFSEIETNSYLSFTGYLAVDSWNRLYVADGGIQSAGVQVGSRGDQTIRVFDQQGVHVDNIGRAGRGPGEFEALSQVHIQSDKLLAYDEISSRLNIYKLRSPGSENPFEFSHSILLDSMKWSHIDGLDAVQPVEFYLRNDDHILVGFREIGADRDPESAAYRNYYLMTLDGKLFPDKIFQRRDVNFYDGTGVPGPQLIDRMTFPSTRSSLIAVFGDGTIYSAWTEDFLIEKYDRKGNYLDAISYPYENRQLNHSQIIELYRDRSDPRVTRRVREEDFPQTWPALQQLMVDDQDRLWIATITDDEEHFEWWVIDEKSELLARFYWPGKRLHRTREPQEIKMVRDGYLYTLETDPETGLQQIVRYGLEWAEIKSSCSELPVLNQKLNVK